MSIDILPSYALLCSVFSDVMSIARSHLNRITLERQQVEKSRRLMSSDGIPYTPLAVILAAPAPAKLCVLAKIVSYYPADIQRLGFIRTYYNIVPREYPFLASIIVEASFDSSTI